MDEETKKLLQDILDELRVIKTVMMVQLPSGVVQQALERTEGESTVKEKQRRRICKEPLEELSGYLRTRKLNRYY